MSRSRGRTATCGAREARFRLNEAREFLDVADLTDSANVAVSNAVLRPGGPEAAKQMRRLLSLKEAAQYGAAVISAGDRRAALRQAQALIDFATGAVRR